MSQQRQAVLRTHSPDGRKDNNGHEVHDVGQTGLFRLVGGGGRGCMVEKVKKKEGEKERKR